MTGRTTIDSATLLDGFDQAAERFHREGRMATRQRGAFIPLFEALSWAVCIDERVARYTGSPGKLNWGWRNSFEGGGIMLGVRYARNRVQHQWADALEITSGVTLPTPVPLPMFEWRWRVELPGEGRTDERSAYSHFLAGQPGRLTLEALHGLFRSVQAKYEVF